MLVERFIKIIKGKDFELDSNIPTSYLINKSVEMIFNLIRGNIKLLLANKNSHLFFVGKNTKIKVAGKITLNKGVNIGDNVVIDALSRDGIKIGNNVRIGDYSRILSSGTIKKLGKGVEIGNNCGIGEYSFFGAAGGIKIGNDVIMGQNVRFHSENHNYQNLSVPIRLQGVTNKGIKIGNDCWIGSGVVFLDGAELGNGCVVAANSVVNKKFSDNSVIAGTPARLIKERGIYE